jgi:hypothetical protein
MRENLFYKQHIPQSDYRRLREKKEENKAYLLDFELKNTEISDTAEKEALKDKIKEEGALIVAAVLPEEQVSEIVNGACFIQINNKLGLL